MRKFGYSAILAIAFIPLAACRSAPPASYGSLDRQAVELLQNGKAKYVDIYSFNDMHGTLAEDLALSEDPSLVGKNPGIAKFARSVALLRQANPNMILVSAGDNYQGSALSILTKGAVMSEEFKAMGLAASAIGNHEFDWGVKNFELARWSVEGGFPFLAANLTEAATGELPPWAQPYVIVSVGGHRIALLGLVTTETLTSTKRENIEFFDFADPAAAAKRWIGKIKRIERPEAIVAITHVPAAMDRIDPSRAIGFEADSELGRLAKVPGLDAIVTGHSHASVNGKAEGVPVVQAYYNGRSLARLAFTFKEDNTFTISSSLVEIYKNKSSISEDPVARGIYDRYMNKYAGLLLEKVAEVEGNLGHEKHGNVTPMGYWVCEALRERFGVQVAVMNGGGLRKGFPEGPVTVQDFWELMPFDNTAVTFKASGATLKRIIDHGIDSAAMGNGQFSGLVVSYDPNKAYESKVLSMTLADGTPVEDEGVYTVVTNDFMFLTGGDGYAMMPANDKSAYVETYIPIRDVLIERARADGTMRAATPEVLIPVSR
jgi:2',3'-cyclic-nucleotide 2'-phosphodiesterase (5'-nucleotidase family)